MDKPMPAFARTPRLPEVIHVEVSRPLLWLKRGWQDFRSNPGPSVAHGWILVALGWLILLMCSMQIDLLATAVSVFLLIGPVMGSGFYALSQLRETGQPATFDASIEGALKNGDALGRLGLVLAVLAIAWVATSKWLFVETFGGQLPSVQENFYRTVFEWDNTRFLLNYLGSGAVFAVVAFILSAVSAPMIFDRAVPARTAILTSIKAIAINPAAMLVWAGLIAAFTAIGFATFLFGLVIVLPLLGHATWHAYRDLVR